MSVKLFVCYEMTLPKGVEEDFEQELFNSVVGSDGGQADIEMFIDGTNYPSLKRHMHAYGIHSDLKMYVEAKLNG